MHRRSAVAHVAIVLVLVGVPAASAQGELELTVARSEIHSIGPGSLRTDLADRPSVDPGVQGGLDPITACARSGDQHFSLVTDPPGLRFTESGTEQGCAQAGLDLNVPPGAVWATVSFAADRLIRSSPDASSIPVRAYQQLRMYDAGQDAPTQTTPLFAPDSSSAPDGRAFTERYALRLGQPTIGFSWFFHDHGGAADDVPGMAPGTAFAATLWDLTVRFDGLPVEATSEVVKTVNQQGQQVETRRLQLLLPQVDAGQEIVVQAPAGTVVAAASAPDGKPLAPGAVVSDDDGTRLRAVLGASALAEHGPGLYTIDLETRTALEPRLALLPVAFLAVAAPGVAAVVAASDVGVIGRNASGGFRQVLAPGRWALAFLAALYLALIIWLFSGPGWRVLITLPVQVETGVAVVALALLSTAFLAIGLFWKKRIGRVMEITLQEQRQINEDLARSNRELQQFANVASHDLQEPLRAVYGYAELLQDRYAHRLDDDGREFLGFVMRGADRMSELVSDLLQYARVDAATPVMGDVDTQQIVEQTGQFLRGSAADLRVEVGELPTIRAEAPLIRQLFLNLLTNAARFGRPDRPPVVHIDCSTRDGVATFSVADNGIGIPPEDRERVFVIFQRLHTQDEVPGTGIGLALCRKIVERYGGRIWITGSKGGGATFNFELPFQDDEGVRSYGESA